MNLQLLPGGNRGATAVLFGASAAVVIGMVGLGTEGGTWYLTRRNAQNAADTAAYAGAIRFSETGSASRATTAATETSTRNGFTAGQNNTTVTVTVPYAGYTSAVEVIVGRTRPRLLSGLFLTADPVIQARGVAAVVQTGPACMLAIPGSSVTGQLLMGGNSSVQAPNCVLASNATGSDAISITGSATVTASSLTSSGGCVGCDSATLSSAYTLYAPPASNPLAHLDSKVLPNFNNNSCYTGPLYTPAGAVTSFPTTGSGNNVRVNGNVTSSLVLPPPPAGKAICDLHVSGNNTVLTLNPGVYYFYNSSFDIQSGKVECRMATTPPTANGALCSGGYGVTLVFTGTPSQIGGPQINANAQLNLMAPTAAYASDPDYAGILFFRDPRATGGNNQGNPAVSINGGANTALTGAMYFPNSYVKYSGNAGLTTCSVLVGGTIEATGNSGLETSQCSQMGYGSIVPTLSAVRLVE